MCECVCGRMEGHCHHYLSNTSLLGKRERRGGATQSCCRERRGKDKKGLLDEVIQLHCTSVERRWRGRKTWGEWEMEGRGGGGGSLWPPLYKSNHFGLIYTSNINKTHVALISFFLFNYSDLAFDGISTETESPSKAAGLLPPRKVLPLLRAQQCITSASAMYWLLVTCSSLVFSVIIYLKVIFKSIQSSDKTHTSVQAWCKLQYLASYPVCVNKAGATREIWTRVPEHSSHDRR